MSTVYQHQIQLIKNQKGLVATTPRIQKEFRSPMRLNQGVQDYWNRKGLISNDGERKQAFYVLQEFYKQLSEQ
jgi:beta-glucuronidase